MKSEETSGMKISFIGAVIFAFMGLGFALYSKSQAVLLDGIFNLVSAVLALFATKISQLITLPSSKYKPAGYVAFEPFYLLLKGIILFCLTIVVMISNVIILINGGNELQLGIITIYIAVAVLGNLITYFLIRRKQRRVVSPLLEVETKNWLVNTLISSGIAVSFLLVYIFKDGVLTPIIPYVDQIVVVLIGFISLPVPLAAIRTGFKELMLMGADEALYEKVSSLLIPVFSSNKKLKKWEISVIKTGRKLWVTAYIAPLSKTLPTDFSDSYRRKLSEELKDQFTSFEIDVIITFE